MGEVKEELNIVTDESGDEIHLDVFIKDDPEEYLVPKDSPGSFQIEEEPFDVSNDSSCFVNCDEVANDIEFINVECTNITQETSLGHDYDLQLEDCDSTHDYNAAEKNTIQAPSIDSQVVLDNTVVTECDKNGCKDWDMEEMKDILSKYKKEDLDRGYCYAKRKIKIFKCLLCTFTSESPSTIINHNQVEHKRCPTCGNAVIDIELENHLQSHNTDAECQICGKRLKQKNLDRHVLKHTIGCPKKLPFTYTCSKCDFTTKNKEVMIRHRKKHIVQVACPICGKEYSQANVNRHIDDVHNAKNIPCEICKKICKNYLSYARHKNLHISEFKECSICKKLLKSRGEIKHHIASHKRKFVGKSCTICNKVIYGNCMVKHMRSHSGELPFKCNYCEKAFSDAWNRKAHERQHTNAKPYNCAHCSAAFAHNVSLKNHMMKKHNINLWKKKTKEDSQSNSSND